MCRFVLTGMFLFLFQSYCPAQAVRDSAVLTSSVPVIKATKEIAQKKCFNRGDRIVYAQVLQLTGQNKEKFTMIVFADAAYENNLSRTRMKIDYVLKRERIYLAKIFFADADVLEELKDVIDINASMKKMEQKYPGLKCWSMLNADMILGAASKNN